MADTSDFSPYIAGNGRMTFIASSISFLYTRSPKYEALSYTWGSASSTKPIFVNSNELRATVNLEAALRHIRRVHQSLAIWIDALCINQDDVAEKTHQVALMGEIYKRCTKCHIWLGCPDEYFEQDQRSLDEAVLRIYKQYSSPFELVSHFAQDKHWYELPCFLPNSGNIDQDSNEYSERMLNLPAWKGFYAVANSTWWKRVWTLQEVVLSPDATVIFGHWTIPWKMIADANNYSTSHEVICCVEPRNRLLGDVYNVMRELFDTTENISAIRQMAQRFRLAQIAFGSRECHDPRDRIYGMLGLHSFGKRLGLDPDYSLQISEIYTKAFQAMIQEYGRDLQAMCGFGFNSVYAGLPSWVPNFATPLDLTLQRRDVQRFAFLYQRYQASKERLSDYSFEEGGILRVRGVKAGVVTDSSVPKRMDSWEEASKALSGSAALARVPEYQPKASRYDTMHEMFWRTVISDIVYSNSARDYRRLLDNDFEEFQKLRLDPAASMYRTEFEFRAGVYVALDNRCFFITEDDKFGTGPAKMEVGDEVWVLFGGNVPFILRPITKAKRADLLNAYSFIGDCYLHGIMDGEALNLGLPEEPVNLY